MTGHRKIRQMLYEYLRSELGEEEMLLVAGHLGRCGRCSREADELRAALELLPPPVDHPSDKLSDSFWSEFAEGIGRRVSAGGAPLQPGVVERAVESVREIFSRHNRVAIAGLAVACVAVILLMGRDEPSGGLNDPDLPASYTDPATTGNAGILEGDTLSEFDLRVKNYFRRSKTLLVGVSNTRPGEGDEYDLDAEQIASRTLVDEARYLKTGPVDPRSWRLMEDLNEIMIELANLDSRTGQPSVVMLREGIENRNLLFKLRMQETQSYRTPVQQASYVK